MARVGADQPADLVDVDDPMRCRAVAGRCERGVHLGDDHYTAYDEGVWRWRIDSLNIAVAQTNGELGLALTEALVDVDRLRGAVETEWHNGNLAEDVRDRILAVAPTSVGGTDG